MHHFQEIINGKFVTVASFATYAQAEAYKKLRRSTRSRIVGE